MISSSAVMLYLLLLVLGSPLGCFILSSILELISLLLGLVDCSLGMLSRSVDGEQTKGSWASVDDYYQHSI
jgi:hypothetical protein